MGKAQRRKGHDWEREVAKSLRELDPSACRQLEYQEGLGVDIALKELPLLIQCKAGARPPWLQAITEAVKAALKDELEKIPVAAIKVDRQGEYAVLVWEDFLTLIECSKKELVEVKQTLIP